MFIGYHSEAGSTGNPLSHTMSGKTQHVIINGTYASEFYIYNMVQQFSEQLLREFRMLSQQAPVLTSRSVFQKYHVVVRRSRRWRIAAEFQHVL